MPTNQMHATRLPNPAWQTTSEWSGLLHMAPSALGLVAPKDALAQGFELLSNAAHGRRFDSVLTRTQTCLREARVPVLVDETKRAPVLAKPEALTRPQRRWLGQLALELYFTQLFRVETTILDLWPSHLGVDAAGDAVWSPRPHYLQWDPAFRGGLRNVYAGFFLNETQRLQDGLNQLRLGAAARPLLQHLGEGHQRSVRFDRGKLESTLHDISKARRSEPTTLHRNFLALGLYLTSLYELLGSLDLAFDVRSAFMRSFPR